MKNTFTVSGNICFTRHLKATCHLFPERREGSFFALLFTPFLSMSHPDLVHSDDPSTVLRRPRSFQTDVTLFPFMHSVPARLDS